MSDVMTETFMLLAVAHETQDAIHAAQDRGATIETRGLEKWQDPTNPLRHLDADFAPEFSDLDGPPKLVMKGVGFTPDAFITNFSLTYMSEHLRTVLDLDPSTVDYIAIDDSQCDADIQRMGYRIAKFNVTYDGVDLDRSSRTTWAKIMGPGMEAVYPKAEPPFEKVVLKSDFAPKARVFHLKGAGGPYVKRDFAARLQAIKDLDVHEATLLSA